MYQHFFIHMMYFNLTCLIQCFRYLILNNLLIYVFQMYNVIDMFSISGGSTTKCRSLEQNKYDKICFLVMVSSLQSFCQAIMQLKCDYDNEITRMASSELLLKKMMSSHSV
jgi:hypothetical protein